MNRALMSSLIIAAFLTIICALDARAQYMPEMAAEANVPAVVQEHRSHSNWEAPLVQQDPNLSHYYWTDVNQNKMKFNVVNPATGKYETVHRTASSCRPVVMRSKCRNILAESMAARASVDAKLRPVSIAQARTAAPAMVYSYGNSYGNVSGHIAPASYGSVSGDKQVRGRVMSY